MGYNLQAFICRQNDASSLTKHFDKAIKIDIEQGLCLIPMTEELFDQINNYTISPSIDQFEYLTDNIENEILAKTNNIMIAYIEADYFGGQGGQTAIIWNNRKREHLFGFGQDKINQVLRNFGTTTQRGKDEFETLGLGRHRNTIDWIVNDD